MASLRHRVLPRPLAVAGIPAAVLMLANALLPMAVITLWFAAASISPSLRRFLRRAMAQPGPAEAMPESLWQSPTATA